MPYPENTWLTRPIRRGIMVGLIALFFVISPLIILYTTGFRYDFLNHRVEQTGVISIDAKPLDADVYLNTVRIKKTMPIRLANRAPGTYHLTLKKTGYMPWERDITVTSQQTTYVKNVSLFKESLPESYDSLSPGHVETMHGSADGSFLLVTVRDDNTTDLHLVNRKNHRVTMIKRMTHDAAPTIAWSPTESTAIIVTNTHAEKILDVISATEEKIIATFSFDSDVLPQWSWTEDRLSLLINGDIVQVGSAGKKIIAPAPQQSVWYVDSQNHLWVFDRQTGVLQDTLDKSATIPAPENTNRILDINQNRAIVASDQAIIILSRDRSLDTTVIAGGRALLNNNTREWIVSSASELWTVYEDGHAILLNRTSDTIISALPLDQYGVLLVATPKSLIGFNPGYYVTHTLLTHAMIESISVDYKNRSIVFLGSIGEHRGLYTLAY